MGNGASRRGRLRIFVGAVPGAGTTTALLEEGHRLRDRGVDVVVGCADTRGRETTDALLAGLEIVAPADGPADGPDGGSGGGDDPTRADHRALDVDALLARAPRTALVDDLAARNPAGARRDHRWQDVEALLAAGVDIVATMTVGELESLVDVVRAITGSEPPGTVPDALAHGADQIELVDATPEELRRRLAEGEVFAPDEVDAALANQFRLDNLLALREVALRWLADRVDDRRRALGPAPGGRGPHAGESAAVRERVVVAVDGAPGTDRLVRRAARLAARSRGDLVAVHVRPAAAVGQDAGGADDELDGARSLVTELGGRYAEVVGDDVAEALLGFAEAEHATQLVVGAPPRRLRPRLRRPLAARLMGAAGPADVHAVALGDGAAGGDGGRPVRPLPAARRRRATQIKPDRRREATGALVAVVGLPLLVVSLLPLHDELNLASITLLFLGLVTVVAVVGGRRPALASAVGAGLLVNWFFTAPVNTFTVEHAEKLAEFLVFLIVAVAVSTMVSRAIGRAGDANRARAEAEALVRLAAGSVGEDDVEELLSLLRSTFGLRAVAVLSAGDAPSGTWSVTASSGEPVPDRPGDHETMPLGDGACLVLAGPPLYAEDRRVLQAFAAHLRVALERRTLRQKAEQAELQAQGDRLRTAILRAVSHDLRTPLASIKASVTSLLQRDVTWSPDAQAEFLDTIDEEVDRLDDLVGNLLDMSRLESGSLDVLARAVGADEVVARALASLGRAAADEVVTDVAESLPRVLADPALLERSVANLVANAVVHAEGRDLVRVEAAVIGDRLHLRVIDRGKGIPVRERDRLFDPFQRLGDQRTGGARAGGVGLGLAVAKGFVDAMGGRLSLDDTPGGGVTATIELVLADHAPGAGARPPTASGRPAPPAEPGALPADLRAGSGLPSPAAPDPTPPDDGGPDGARRSVPAPDRPAAVPLETP